MAKEWFKDWFNSPYYHVLYKNRDYKEAERFVGNLINYFNPDRNDKFLDVACGKGRHSVFINKKGFYVDGFDLASESIQEAQKSETSTLKFYVHDMRSIFRTNYYNYALNLFTSFGYFKSERDEQNALKTISSSIKPDGKFVIDFLNAQQVIDNLIESELKEIDGVKFQINKSIKGKHVVKKISFKVEEGDFAFEEKVKLLRLEDFKRLFDTLNLKIEQVFGDYDFNEYSEKSPRLILIGSRN